MRNGGNSFFSRSSAALLAGACAAVLATTACAFPPAPYHTIYGLVRDEFGNPLMTPGAVVTLTTTGGVNVSSTIVPNLEPGVNYRLQVPIDAGLSVPRYKPTALRPQAAIALSVVFGGATYYPMEISANFANLGQSAQMTRLNMTLGVDSDGDGLPDAWEWRMVEMGYGVSLADIRPQDDSDGDRLSNMDEYLVGTYAFDAADTFRLESIGLQDGKSMFEFLVLPGRNYTVEWSTDMQNWSNAGLRVHEGGVPGALQASYSAKDVTMLRVGSEAVAPDGKSLVYRAVVR